MQSIKINLENCNDFITIEETKKMNIKVDSALDTLVNKTGKGNDYLGWYNLPNTITNEDINDIKETAKSIRNKCDVFIVIGIGGSYLGSKAIIDALSGYKKSTEPEVIFLGNSISSTYLNDILKYIKDKEVCVNVISKSGTTTEPALAFRFINEFMEKKYGDKAYERITATTDEKRGALKSLATNKGYKTFVIPDDVGGRYSVLTPVGLLPIAVAGFDIEKFIEGSKFAYSNCESLCKEYVTTRNILYKKGKKIEIMANYEPKLHFLTEWWKQLFGESEGKDKLGIFPAGVDFTSDLHSMGQYIQDGERILFETVLDVKNPEEDLLIPVVEEDLDGLKYIEGKSVNFVNSKAIEGTINAHVSGGVPNIVIEIPEICEETLGQLVYFFEKSCGISGYVLDVNPFNQPGVEEYKTNMFKLLKKPGY